MRIVLWSLALGILCTARLLAIDPVAFDEGKFAEPKAAASQTAKVEKAAEGIQYPDVPEPISSFGAAICGDYIYVYSGHTGDAHAHSKENLSKHFSRIHLTKPEKWESLPMETAMQGLAVVSDGKKVYRVGGLVAHNSPDDSDHLESLTEVSAFDPETKTWAKMPPLPAGRSSHDAWIVDGVLYAIGGWKLSDAEPVWHDRSVKLNLKEAGAKWEELPAQPFRRRALSVVAVGKKVYAIGGMNEDAKPSTDVHAFDIDAQTWSAVPSLPGKGLSGFGSGAAVLGDKLYVTTMEGHIYRLDDGAKEWKSAGELKTPRFFHRLLPVTDDALLAIGGASQKLGHLKSPEWLVPQSK